MLNSISETLSREAGRFYLCSIVQVDRSSSLLYKIVFPSKEMRNCKTMKTYILCAYSVRNYYMINLSIKNMHILTFSVYFQLVQVVQVYYAPALAVQVV